MSIFAVPYPSDIVSDSQDTPNSYPDEPIYSALPLVFLWVFMLANLGRQSKSQNHSSGSSWRIQLLGVLIGVIARSSQWGVQMVIGRIPWLHLMAYVDHRDHVGSIAVFDVAEALKNHAPNEGVCPIILLCNSSSSRHLQRTDRLTVL